MTRIGQLADRVVIQRNATVTDSQGGRTSSWGLEGGFDAIAFDDQAFGVDYTLATVWANVRPASASEQMQAQAVQSVVSYAVMIRYRADVTPSMRLSWTPYQSSSAKTLQILGVYPVDGARTFLQLTCGEVA